MEADVKPSKASTRHTTPGGPMDREGIKQRVLDALGVIIVDKSHIHEEATFEELVLDEDDVNELLKRLEGMFGCRFPAFVRERASLRPEHVSLPMLVDLILLMQQETGMPSRSNEKGSSTGKRRS
ncbi:hypothetical protein [Pseudomonas syringae]